MSINLRDAPLGEVFRRIEQESGVRILWPAALAEDRITMNLDEPDVERAIRKVLRGARRAAESAGLVVFYEQGHSTPKMILIFHAPAPGARTAPPADEVRTLPYLAPPEPPRYIPPASEPEPIPVDRGPREIPTRVPSRGARSYEGGDDGR